jgi:hypothetical protein
VPAPATLGSAILTPQSLNGSPGIRSSRVARVDQGHSSGSAPEKVQPKSSGASNKLMNVSDEKRVAA